MCMRAKPVSLSCFMVERVYVFRRFNELNVRSHSLVVTGNVHSILKRNSTLEQCSSAECGLVGRSPTHNVYLFSQRSNSASRVREFGRSVSYITAISFTCCLH